MTKPRFIKGEDWDACDRCLKECHGEEYDDMTEIRGPDGYEMLCEDCHAIWDNETKGGTI